MPIDSHCFYDRLSSAASMGDLDVCVQGERLLLQTYNIKLPECRTFPMPPGKQDAAATGVLRMFQPVLLADYIPLSVSGDGNCLYRALSRGLFGHEEHHMHIRLLTAMEIAEHRDYYDTYDPAYQDLIKDDRLIHDPYQDLLQSASKPGEYSEMMMLYAASAALSVGVQSYCPPALNAEFLADPLTKKIFGRGVRTTTAPAVTIMWTTTFVPKCVKEFRPNHFVVLHKKQTPIIIDLTEPANYSAPMNSTCSDLPDVLDVTPLSRGEEDGPSLLQSSGMSSYSPPDMMPKTQPHVSKFYIPSPMKTINVHLDARYLTTRKSTCSDLPNLMNESPLSSSEEDQPSLHQSSGIKSSVYPSPGMISRPQPYVSKPCASSPSEPTCSSKPRNLRTSGDLSTSHLHVHSVSKKNCPSTLTTFETSKISIDTDEVRVATGGHDVPEKGKFLNISQLVAVLTTTDTVPHEHIPVGLKENQYFNLSLTMRKT